MFILNEDVIVRQGIDDGALLFSANTGEMFSLNQTSTIIYEILKTNPTFESLIEQLEEKVELPAEAKSDVNEFLQELISRGFLTESK